MQEHHCGVGNVTATGNTTQLVTWKEDAPGGPRTTKEEEVAEEDRETRIILAGFASRRDISRPGAQQLPVQHAE
jgi:hypothetical protein